MNTMKTIAKSDIATLINKSFESDIPEKILAALQPFSGKNITTRIEAAVQKALPNFHISLVRHYGWTDISWASPERAANGDPALYGNFMLARSEASVPLDLEWVEKENPAYFDARVKRNNERTALLADVQWQEDATDAANALNAAVDAMKAVLQRGDVVRYSFRKEFLSPDLAKAI